MRLVSAKVGPFKSINEPQTVQVREGVTVLVGMNEAGKTVFLQALQKSNDALGLAAFDPVPDYPRKDLPTYLQQHKTKPDDVTALTYRLTEDEVAELNEEIGTKLPPNFSFSVTRSYDNKIRVVTLQVDERPAVQAIANQSDISSEVTKAVKKASAVRVIPEALKGLNLTEPDKAMLAVVESRIAKSKWESVVQWEAWQWLSSRLPKFLYFSSYELLPSKMNLPDLAHRVEQAKTDPKHLEPEHRAVLALLRMADISVTDFTQPGGYETLKAKIEAVSISLTDQVMEFWKQNEQLEVEVDIKPDSEDVPPFNNGPNLYLRIRNLRHRGVSTPFAQRSHGFIWFFSFLVWFDSVQHQLQGAPGAKSTDLILLLDEPGLSLHALAQADFLRYIDKLAARHQVLYTTHSPFMVHSDRLFDVRLVEDRGVTGTVVSENLEGSDPRTLFPLQAALGWTIAQNLFISRRNLLVEGPSDLIYLKAMSAILEAHKKSGLNDDVTIVPTGGLDKVVTFVALLGANKLELAVLHDYRGAPDQKLMDLVKEKMISPKAVLNASQFRDLGKLGITGPATDTEDLLPTSLYLDCFNKAFAKALGGVTIKEADLPAGSRVVDRIERHLAEAGIRLRPSGGFNHYTVASYFASNPPTSLDAESLDRFEALFKAVNALF